MTRRTSPIHTSTAPPGQTPHDEALEDAIRSRDYCAVQTLLTAPATASLSPLHKAELHDLAKAYAQEEDGKDVFELIQAARLVPTLWERLFCCSRRG